MIKHLLLFVSLIVMMPITSVAQQKIKGKVVDLQTGESVPFAYVTIKRISQGIATDGEGLFELQVQANDTLIISTMGYNVRTVILAAEAQKEFLTVRLTRKTYQLPSVVILAPKDLKEVKDELRDIKSFQYEVQGFEAVQSPITFLYERFSRIEKSKRKVQEMINQDNRMEAMKQLLAAYIQKEIISLDKNEVESFINYCNLSDEFIINSTEYDLILQLKQCYTAFRGRR